MPAAPSDLGARTLGPRLARSSRAATIVALAASIGTLAGARTARAQMVYQLAPTVGVGITDNADVSVDPNIPRRGGGYGTVSAIASADDQLARSRHSLAYVFAFTRFFNNAGPDTLTNTLTWTSAFELSPRLTLNLSAGAVLSRVSRVDFNDLTIVMPQANTGGNAEFVTVTASEGVVYQPTARRTYTETVRVSQLNYINLAGAPTNDFIAVQARASQIVGLNTFFLDTQISDSFITSSTAGASPLASGQNFIGQLAAGWERDISPTLSTQIQAGPIAAFRLSNPAYAIFAPGGSASLNYQSRPWFATVTLSQAAAPNLFLGSATINRQVLARLALPLRRDELVFVTGFGGYIYARLASAAASGRLFDQWMTGLAVSGRLPRLPIAASIQYTLIDQNGGAVTGYAVPGLERQTLTLNIGGIFSWGAGTPPLFRGTL